MKSRPLDAVGNLISWVERVTGIPRSGIEALVILLLGWLFAWLLRFVVTRATRRLIRALPGDGAFMGELARPRVARGIGRTAFWVAILITVLTASETLGWKLARDGLTSVASYVPRVLAGVVIMAAGLAAGRIVRTTITRTGGAWNLNEPEIAGRIAQAAVVVAAALVTVEQLGIGITLLTTAFTVVAAALLGAAALAFGLGSRDAVANILAAHYVRQLYRVGHTVRIDEIEGRLVRVGRTMVTLDCDVGQMTIPARRFLQTNSLRVGETK